MIGSVVPTFFAIEDKYVCSRLNYNVLLVELHHQALCWLRLLQHWFPHYRRYGELKFKVCQFIFLGRIRRGILGYAGQTALSLGREPPFPQNFAERDENESRVRTNPAKDSSRLII